MGTSSAGSIVLVPFPFADLSKSKLRPAVVLAEVGRGDRILCQITSNPYGDRSAVPLVVREYPRDTCGIPPGRESVRTLLHRPFLRRRRRYAASVFPVIS